MSPSLAKILVCPLCHFPLVEMSPNAVECRGPLKHVFPVVEGAPLLLVETAGRAVSLQGLAADYRAWAAQWGMRWDGQRRKIWRAVLRAAARAAPPPGAFADLGAGNGGLAALAAHAGYDAIALDAAMPEKGPYVRAGADFEALPLEDGSLRVAAFVAALHYSQDLRAALGEARRVLDDQGVMVVALTPIHFTPEGAASAADTTRREIRAATGDRGLAAAYHHLTRPELVEALEAAGFLVEERPSGLGMGERAARQARALLAGDAMARFPLLVCSPGGQRGANQ